MNRIRAAKNITGDANLGSNACVLFDSQVAQLENSQVAEPPVATPAPQIFEILIAGLNGEICCASERITLPAWKAKKAKELISLNLGDVQISKVAEQCALSRSHFSRAFKKTTGLSPKDWLVGCRIKRAQEMLISANLTLTEISLECGFADQSHFSRTFRKVVGVTPAKWRHGFFESRELEETEAVTCESSYFST